MRKQMQHGFQCGALNGKTPQERSLRETLQRAQVARCSGDQSQPSSAFRERSPYDLPSAAGLGFRAKGLAGGTGYGKQKQSLVISGNWMTQEKRLARQKVEEEMSSQLVTCMAAQEKE